MLLLFVLLHASTSVWSMVDIHNETKHIGHLVVITSPFFGHMIPLLDFAKRLSLYHHVTYVVSISKLDLLKRHGFIDENETNNTTQTKLEFIGLFDNNDDDYEVTNARTSIPIQTILDRMHEPLLQLLFAPPITTSSADSTSSLLFSTRSIRHPIDMIISDLFVFTPVLEAFKRNIASYLFLPSSLMAFTRYINMSTERIKGNELGLDFDRQMHKTIPLTKGLICNSAVELDKQALDELRQQLGPIAKTPILFVTPLMSEEIVQKQQQTAIIAYIKEWLDKQWEKENKSSSVIYISFGSWASLESKQLIEITRALLPYPFIWSLKKKLQMVVSSLDINDQQHLFLDWAPQRFILSHPAIRLFISHGGWNSLLESMSFGKPTLVWPLFGDQIHNGHRLEYELGMGRCIQNTDLTINQRIISSNELTRYAKEMFDVKKEYVRKAQKVQQMMAHARENSSRLDFEEIIKTISNQIITHKKKHNEL